jgi:hypothetical protein
LARNESIKGGINSFSLPGGLCAYSLFPIETVVTFGAAPDGSFYARSGRGVRFDEEILNLLSTEWLVVIDFLLFVGSRRCGIFHACHCQHGNVGVTG